MSLSPSNLRAGTLYDLVLSVESLATIKNIELALTSPFYIKSIYISMEDDPT
jgi:hypothetical protein